MKQLLLTLAAGLTPALALAQNVGIGTTTPAERLEVTGNVQIPGTSDYKYGTAKTCYKQVPPVAFTYVPTGFSTAFLVGPAAGESRYLIEGNTGVAGFLVAPLDLPDDAVVTQVVLYVYDNSSSYDVFGNLYQIITTSSNVINLAQTGTTSGTPGGTSLSVSLNAVVDNATSAYYLRFNTYENTSLLRIRGARITYTVLKAD